MENWGFRVRAALAAAGVILGIALPARAATSPYPVMAPLEQYQMARADEIALARSAAPPSISKDAEVRVFGPHGYEVAAKGTNGFVCFIERAWASPLNDPEFWNPRIRAPLCMNPIATRTELPEYLMRTRWVLSGATREQVIERAKAAVASKQIVAPEPGAMCYMMSKNGYLSDNVGGPWHPHLMFFLPRSTASMWGANEPGSPIFGFPSDFEPGVTLVVPVSKWSDGTPFTQA